MEKNYLNRVVWMVLAVVLGLLALYWLPEVNIGGWTMRKVDLLADIRNDSSTLVLAAGDSTIDEAKLKRIAALDKLPVIEGSRLTHDKDGNIITLEDSIINAMMELGPKSDSVTAIVDMSGEEQGGMEAFYRALAHCKSRQVRIAVLGDSFIEGDIMTSMLRELLQQRFGGSGCGYLPITSITSKIRLTVRQSYEGWIQHKAIDRNGYMSTYNNLTGYYFNATTGAWVNLLATGGRYPHTSSCTKSSLYYLGGGGSGTVTAYVNGERYRQFALDTSAPVGRVDVTGNIKSVKWVVDNPASTIFLGTSMDTDNGVTVDNLSMRSSRGKHLLDANNRLLAGFDAARHYDLVIIMYGLNIASKERRDFTTYCNNTEAAIANIKQAMPSTSIILASCSDRAERTSDGFRTMKSVLGLIQAQKRVAINSRVAFWNLYDAMGGEGSIVDMVNRHEASSDYTHMSNKGGDHIARLLYNALMLGYDNHK